MTFEEFERESNVRANKNIFINSPVTNYSTIDVNSIMHCRIPACWVAIP